MKTRFALLACLALTLLVPYRSARAEAEHLYCAHGHGWLAAGADSSEFLKYAPSREIDILHVAIDATPDFKARSVSAKTTLRFVPIAKPFAELKLNAIDFTVSTVESSEKILGYHATDQTLSLFDKLFQRFIGSNVEPTESIEEFLQVGNRRIAKYLGLAV